MSTPDRRMRHRLATLSQSKVFRFGLGAVLTVAVAASVIASAPSSTRAVDPVNLGNAASFAVLAGTSVNNQNTDNIVHGDLGVSPGDSVIGFPPGEVTDGEIHAADSLAASAKSDMLAVYNDLASRTPVTPIASELGGTTKGPGIYSAGNGIFAINGVLTLDAQSDPDAIFVFKAASLTTAQVSNITLTKGAQMNNVFFLLSGSATIGIWATFRGNLLAQNSITVSAGATVSGRLFAFANNVNMQSGTAQQGILISTPQVRPSITTLVSSQNPSQQGQQITFTATVNQVSGTVKPKGEVVFKDGPTIIGSGFIGSDQTVAYSTSSLGAGRHEITAVYLGGDVFDNEAVVTFGPSESNVVTQDVTASLWGSGATPSTESFTDSQAVTVGVKFKPTASGTIRGVRFYKGSLNTGTHTGALWTNGGQSLATATFTNESSSGWQQVNFTTPVPVTVGTTYVASYHTTSGYYSTNRPYFTSEHSTNHLIAPGDGAAGGNGVYAYGASNTFPNSSFQATNYWVDVVFVPHNTLWSSTATPAVQSQPDSQAVTVGVKFQATGAGTIQGIRFYKGASNNGTHTGALWTGSGQLLASAVFTNEDASGWQHVHFATPVSISADTTYVAGYHTTSGYYSVTRPYFTQQHTSGALIALANGASPNGLYSYGAGTTFPTNSVQATNYWVDVIFALS